MKYRDGETYQGEYAGVKITFSLENLREDIIERFSRGYAERVVQQMQKEQANEN